MINRDKTSYPTRIFFLVLFEIHENFEKHNRGKLLKYWDISLYGIQNLENLIVPGIEVARIKLLFLVHFKCNACLLGKLIFKNNALIDFQQQNLNFNHEDIILNGSNNS